MDFLSLILQRQLFQTAAVRRVQHHTGLTQYFLFLTSARMSKIKNGGLDQYGKLKSLNEIGGERVKNRTILRKSDTINK